MKKEFGLKDFDFRLQNEKLGLSSLIVLWLVVQLIAYVQFDMRVSVDSELYIMNAVNLTKGVFPEGREFFYSTYSMLIAIPVLLGLKANSVIFIHLGIALITVVCIYKLTQHISKDNKTAFVAAVLYVLWFKFQQWNLIIYTDAIFSNLLIISTYALFIANKKIQFIFAFFLITFTVLIRPTGIGLFFAVIIYLGFQFTKYKSIGFITKAAVFAMLILISIIILNLILGHFIDSFIVSYSNAEIIYPEISLFINKPNSFITPNKDYPPLIQLLLLIIQNPLYMLKITLVKGALFVGHVKPYYSAIHNIFIVGFLYPVYIFAIKGYKVLPKGEVKYYILSFILFQFITVSLTSENWDGRFLLPVLPFVFILASIGMANFFKINKVVSLW